MLKKKDGSEYRLAGPNPIMNNQTLWSEYKVHNMTWPSEKDEIKQEVVPISSDLTIKESFLSALDNAQIDMTEEKEEITEDFLIKKEVVHEDRQRKEEIEEDNKIEKTFIHCLPAKIKEKKDDLYGETYKTIQYEKPTSFEGVVLNQGDLMIEIWTDVPISLGSIIYPKIRTKRWWKIHSKTDKAGGWIIVGIPSTYQPSFDL